MNKKNKPIYIIFLILIVSTLSTIILKRYFLYKNTYIATANPFISISVLDNKINLKDNEKTYALKIDCSSLKDSNEQILNYQLKEEYKDSSIKVSSIILDNDKILIDKLENITNININISIILNKKIKYEQIYNINAICENNKY